MVMFPIHETQNIMDAMEHAEKAGDLKALQWCARFLKVLWDDAEITGDDSFYNCSHLFNRMWDSLLKADPAPESIANLINRKEDETEEKYAS